MSSLDAARDGRRWPVRFLQISLTVTALLMFGQAVLAGLFMGGAHSAFAWHREMATVTGIALMIAIVAAVLATRLGRAPRWLIGATVGLLALMSLQAFAGFRSLAALHVPLGVIVILVAVALIGVLTVPLVGGRLSLLAGLRLHGLWAVWASIATQLAITVGGAHVPSGLARFMHLASFALAATGA